MTRTRRLERGGVSTIVAVFLGGGVLFGMAAIGIDVGNLLWERRQLQNAADSAALSLAAECGKSSASCTFTPGDQTSAYANRNSQDNSSRVVSACSVNIAGSPINSCPAASTALTECPPLPGALASMTNLPYVEVRTASQSGSNGFVTNWFAELLGNKAGGASKTTEVNACSRAAIGVPGGQGTADLPLSFSGCDWQHATGGTLGGGGGAYYPGPDYVTWPTYGYGPGTWPAAAATPPAQNLGGEVILVSQNPPGGAIAATPCPTWNGHALPGGFGALETVAGDVCKFVEYSHHWMKTSTGNNLSCDLSQLVGKVVNLPIFDCTNTTAPDAAPPVNGCTTGNGSNAYYHRAGFAAFYLSGYDLNVTSGIPNKHRSLVTNDWLPCSGATRCISGWFVTGELSATTITGPPAGGGFGTYAVVPAG